MIKAAYQLNLNDAAHKAKRVGLGHRENMQHARIPARDLRNPFPENWTARRAKCWQVHFETNDFVRQIVTISANLLADFVT